MTYIKLSTFLLCLLASTTSFAFGMRNANLGGVSEADCGMRSNTGNTNAISEMNCMLNPESCLHQAAWYQDRDNSMSAVSTEEGVGAAMATFWTLSGFSQGVQVCPGVYLGTAHGVLDDPRRAQEEGRPVRGPLGNSVRVAAYPINPENVTRASQSSTQYVSPRLRDPSNWSDSTTDYVFVKVDNPIRPNNFVRPIRADNQRLVEASNRGQMDVHLYRPQTRFNTDENGTPDFNNETWAEEANDVAALYQEPLKVNQSCQLVPGYDGLVGSDCPTEHAVSGSSNVANLNGQDYLVGLHIHGGAISEESFEATPLPNAFVPSASFCEDYESVCGQPCVDLSEVLPEQGDGISI